jgi:hypothetical protein
MFCSRLPLGRFFCCNKAVVSQFRAIAHHLSPDFHRYLSAIFLSFNHKRIGHPIKEINASIDFAWVDRYRFLSTASSCGDLTYKRLTYFLIDIFSTCIHGTHGVAFLEGESPEMADHWLMPGVGWGSYCCFW